MKFKIGITGGIGSGKTSVAEIIKTSGYQVFNADSIAKEIMLSDENVKNFLILFAIEAFKTFSVPFTLTS